MCCFVKITIFEIIVLTIITTRFEVGSYRYTNKAHFSVTNFKVYLVKYINDFSSINCMKSIKTLYQTGYKSLLSKNQTLVKKHARYCGSAEKCHFTLCIAVFSALSRVAPFFSALNVGTAALYGHSALHGPAAHIQHQSQRTEKCHFMPCIAIFFSAENIIFFTREVCEKEAKCVKC